MGECCSGDLRIMYSCSGAADVGELADRVARKLRDDGFAKLSCLAGIGAGHSGYIQSALGADAVITIDGCATACARKVIERNGASPRSYLLSDFGLAKGSAPVTEETVNRMSEAIKGDRRSASGAATATSGGCGCGGTC